MLDPSKNMLIIPIEMPTQICLDWSSDSETIGVRVENFESRVILLFSNQSEFVQAMSTFLDDIRRMNDENSD